MVMEILNQSHLLLRQHHGKCAAKLHGPESQVHQVVAAWLWISDLTSLFLFPHWQNEPTTVSLPLGRRLLDEKYIR